VRKRSLGGGDGKKWRYGKNKVNTKIRATSRKTIEGTRKETKGKEREEASR